MSIKKNKYIDHSFFMQLALKQASKSLGNTKDNPAVGCVLVKDNCLISAGNTSENGRPHAEHNAIYFNTKNIKNSHLYVTLEPCSHYGKTPPCVKTIIKNKIKKVFFSVKDPDPRSYGKSFYHFKNHHIETKNGIYSKEIKKFYRSYFKYKKNKLPFVTCKLAVSKDFFTINKKHKWITNYYSRRRVHLLRANHDCLLTSVKTIISDDPKLTCRIQGLRHKSPSRVILDKNLKIPTKSKIITDAKKYKTIIFYNTYNHKKITKLKKMNVKLVKMHCANGGNFDLRDILIKIKKLNFSRIFLETGLNLTSSFLQKNLIDDFHLFVSGQKIGKNGINSFKKHMKIYLKKKHFTENKVNLFGESFLTFRFK